ncbi:hypothetical protein AAF712_012022 [Marasmius tenuissimus]|uniref:Uncharacterized protein n=1 Tax=Marasmius tenuissimus TaxID=585030 RepID=A0ABR2ZL17_9AGAR
MYTSTVKPGPMSLMRLFGIWNLSNPVGGLLGSFVTDEALILMGARDTRTPNHVKNAFRLSSPATIIQFPAENPIQTLMEPPTESSDQI